MTASEAPAAPFQYEGKDLEAMDFAVNYHSWILSAFDPYVGNKLLEVGAGTGAVSRMILERYRKESWLLEPSEMLHQLHKNLDGFEHRDLARPLSGFLGAQHGFLKHQEIDTAFYVNVLEHIEDDRGELATVFATLKPGGHVLTFSPALPWLYGKFDASVGHFRRYYLKEMKEKMTSAGFEVVRGHYFDGPGMLAWWVLYRVLKKSRLSGKNVDLYDRWVVPILRHIEPSRLLPCGKNILVVGRKPTAEAAVDFSRRAA
ncbi:MAG: class I SAM-dependent methyltransferase [Planctomycetes bacterium]|nr:class I SAM-dependent methyltransferase [Planctomycetota bacterium]